MCAGSAKNSLYQVGGYIVFVGVGAVTTAATVPEKIVAVVVTNVVRVFVTVVAGRVTIILIQLF